MADLTAGAGRVLSAFAASLPADAEAALAHARAHGVAPGALEGAAPGEDALWQAAVARSRERAQRIGRAREVVAEALAPMSGVALADGLLGPEFSADVDVYVRPDALEAAGAALVARGAVAVDAVERRLRGGGAGPDRHFALLEDGAVLAPVELVLHLWDGGPGAAGAVARAQDGRLTLADVAARRTAKAAASRQPTVRALAELTALLELGAPLPRGSARGALSRHAELERELLGDGPVQAAVSRWPRRPGARVLWLRARLRAARSLMRPRRGQLRVAFVGVDGAGKSTQAERLAGNLRAAGVPAVAEWSRLGNRALAPVAALAKLAQRLLPAGSHSFEATREAVGRADPDADPSAVTIPLTRRGPIGWAWALAVTLDYIVRTQAARRRARGHVLVLDRALPDALVGLEDNYGVALRLGLQRRLLERLTPAPHLVIYLRLPGAVAKARKDDTFTAAELEIQRQRYERLLERLGDTVLTLDAQRSREQIAEAALAAAVSAAQQGTGAADGLR